MCYFILLLDKTLWTKKGADFFKSAPKVYIGNHHDLISQTIKKRVFIQEQGLK